MKTDKYFRINLESSTGLISIHEQKKLLPSEYHSNNENDCGEYTILVAVEKTIGREIYSMGVHPESYKTYELRNIAYQIINDYNVDGFEYDRERKVIFYGWIYGIYATKNENNYYDVITGEEIPREIISSTCEMISIANYSEMIEDLNLIKEHKDVYISITKERFYKLSQGAINRKIASQRYKQNYEVRKKAYHARLVKREKQFQKMCEDLKTASCSKREEVKRLIHQIRNI